MAKKSKEAKEELNGKQKKFCEEYIFDFNASRAYSVAYPEAKSDDGIRASASALLTNPNIQAFIKELQSDLEKTSGISRMRVLKEHEKLAFSSIAHLHNTWIERKEFDKLTDRQKDSIAQIETQTRRLVDYTIEPGKEDGTLVDVEFVKVKLYDKQKALDSISRMLGFDAAEKIEHSLPNLKSYKIVAAGGKGVTGK